MLEMEAHIKSKEEGVDESIYICERWLTPSENVTYFWSGAHWPQLSGRSMFGWGHAGHATASSPGLVPLILDWWWTCTAHLTILKNINSCTIHINCSYQFWLTTHTHQNWTMSTDYGLTLIVPSPNPLVLIIHCGLDPNRGMVALFGKKPIFPI